MSGKTTRRNFVGACAAWTVVGNAAFGRSARKLALGFDNFAIRGLGLKAAALIDYAARLRCDSVFISDLDALDGFETNYLADLRRRATDQNVGIHLGTWSICPSSTAFKSKWGTADELLATGIKAAAALGSPVLRVVLGNGGDRATPGGIQARIRDTVTVLKRFKSRAIAAGVKIAVENHAGDMQAWELVELVEAAGTDFVGVNYDSGNSLWTMEDPLDALEKVGRYIATTSLRDGMVWHNDGGAVVQWTAMGAGSVDWPRYFARHSQLCPDVPVHIETISGFPRELPYLKADFWKPWPNARAGDFARFLALAKRGKPIAPFRGDAEEQKRFQESELAKSLEYCRSIGLGRKS